MENKEMVVDKLLCMACLCVGRSLHNISNPKMQEYYLEILNEVPLCNIPQTCPSICWECVAILRKAVTFRQQVKDSYRILQTYTSENLHECLLSDITCQPHLTIHHADSITIPSDEINHTIDSHATKPNDDDFTIKEYIENNRNETKTKGESCNDDDKNCDEKLGVEKVDLVCIKNEFKIEWAGVIDDGFDDDRPLSEYSDNVTNVEADIQTLLRKTEKKKRKKSVDKLKSSKKGKKKEKTKQKLKRPKSETEQKIHTIELSYEEMLEERQKDVLKESYVKSEYKCESCLIGFNYVKTYKAHLTSKHSPDLEYSCPICKTTMASVDSFTAHYRRHLRRYECTICQKRTMDMKVMQQHYYSTHELSPKEYKCNMCGKVSNSLHSHRYHQGTHKARVECPDCDKTFSHRAGLMNHRLAVHEFHNEFPCPVCSKVFRWKTSLKRHLCSHSSARGSARAFCPSCSVSFSSVSSYRRHLASSRRHVPIHQLRFICDHCNRRFVDKTKLRDHIEEKHLHKTYSCHICHKPSKNRVGLDQHVRNVHKRRPNNKMCHHCGKSFPTKVQLESHIRTHTGERPFICEYCPTTFSQQSNLYKHNRQVHLNIKSKRYPVSKKKEGGQMDPPPDLTAAPYLPRPAAVLHYSPERGFVM